MSVDNAFKAAAAHFGADYHIDVVVNNAGYSLSGDTESATEQEMHDELETLFFGTVRVTMNAVKVMRQENDHRGGLIFNISSLAGVCGFPGHAFYHAGKFAVEGWTESVAREMHPDWNGELPSLSLGRFDIDHFPQSTSVSSNHLASRLDLRATAR